MNEAIPAMAAIVMIFGIPIVAIVTAHQRKMAEIIHRAHNDPNNQALNQMYAELQHSRAEIAELRDRLNRLELDRDDLTSRLAPPQLQARD